MFLQEGKVPKTYWGDCIDEQAYGTVTGPQCNGFSQILRSIIYRDWRIWMVIYFKIPLLNVYYACPKGRHNA